MVKTLGPLEAAFYSAVLAAGIATGIAIYKDLPTVETTTGAGVAVGAIVYACRKHPPLR